MRIQVERLKHHADVPAHCVDIGVAIHHIDAVDANHSAARFLEAIAAAQERTLAGAGGTNDEDELLRFDGKIDPTRSTSTGPNLLRRPRMSRIGVVTTATRQFSRRRAAESLECFSCTQAYARSDRSPACRGRRSPDTPSPLRSRELVSLRTISRAISRSCHRA